MAVHFHEEDLPEGVLVREEEDNQGYLKRWKRSSAESFYPFDDGI